MVQIVENWSRLHGRVMNISADSVVRGYSAIELEVFEVKSVDGFPNLFEDAVGERVQLFVQAAESSVLSVGDDVTLRVRRAGPNRVFAASD